MTRSPAYLWVPPHTSSAGREAIDLASTLGVALDAEQQLVLEVALAEDDRGSRVAFETCVVQPRQNGKTATGIALALHELCLGPAELVIWSAHLFATTAEVFRAIRAVAENFDHLRKRVNRVQAANGYEAIELTNGRRMLFRARTKLGGRGLSADLCVLDESFSLEPDAMASLLPTLSARPGSRVVYLSSAGMPESAVLRGLRDRGRTGGDPSLAYVEWAAPQKACSVAHCDHRLGSFGCALDDVELWRAANPAMGSRITVDAVAAERRALPPAEFARERLGWWDDPGGTADGLPFDRWTECVDIESQIADAPVFGVAVAGDLSWACVAAAGRRDDGVPHVEVVDYRNGVEWVAARCADLVADHAGSAVVVEAAGPRSALVDDLEDAGITVEEAALRDLVEACGQLEDRVLRCDVAHLGQAELDMAVRAARRRPVGDAWTWARRASPVEISPLVAVTLALWGVRNAQPETAEADFFTI